MKKALIFDTIEFGAPSRHYLCQDEKVLDWVFRPVDFNGEFSVYVPVPDTNMQVLVHVGTFENDKILALIDLHHPSLTELGANFDDTDIEHVGVIVQ